MNSKNSELSDLHRLLLNIIDKINLKSSDKYVALSNLSIYYTGKNIKNIKIADLKYQLRYGMMSSNYPMDHIQDIFKLTWRKADNPSIRIYVNKIENRITFKIKTEYYL